MSSKQCMNADISSATPFLVASRGLQWYWSTKMPILDLAQDPLQIIDLQAASCSSLEVV